MCSPETKYCPLYRVDLSSSQRWQVGQLFNCFLIASVWGGVQFKSYLSIMQILETLAMLVRLPNSLRIDFWCISSITEFTKPPIRQPSGIVLVSSAGGPVFNPQSITASYQRRYKKGTSSSLLWHSTLKREILALSEELRQDKKCNG